MRNFLEWFHEKGLGHSKPWLVLGKGPSFAKRDLFDLQVFHTLSLNHVVREQAVTVAHMIDLDVLEGCGDKVERNADVVVLPWHPHINNRASSQNLSELVKKHDTLKRLNKQGRLLWYNLSTARQPYGESPVVTVRFFSAEAAVNLLAHAGVRRIRSLGVDGGSDYSDEFADLRGATLLKNTRTSFDRQFGEIAEIILRTGIDYAPLEVDSPIRIWVGSTESEMLPLKVLEYSIRKHASMSVTVEPLCFSGTNIPLPKEKKNLPRSPFSFQRFLIPELCGHRGRAIYLDADMLVFKDVRALWTKPLDGADVLSVQDPAGTGRRPQFSVMVLNCDSLRWNIQNIIRLLDQGDLSYEELVYDLKIANCIRRTIDPTWNSLESYSEGKTALLHYTDMNTQPWISAQNSLGYLWVRELCKAVEAGFIMEDFVEEQVTKGNVRPSLLYQLEHRVENSLLMPKKARSLDRAYCAPFHGITRHSASAWLRPTRILQAALRHWYHRSPAFRMQRKIMEYLSK